LNWTCSKAFVVLGLLLLALPALAQLKLDGLTMSADGILGAGYDGSSGTNQTASHDLGINASGELSGYYFNPKFLSFSVLPSYNRSQSNSGSSSLTNASDIDTNVQLFTGSHFPGAVSYNKAFDSTGTFGLPGVQSFVTHGDTSTFGIGWSALLSGLPPVNVSFTQSSSSSTIFGTTQETLSSSRVFNVNSAYRMAGWGLQGRFTDVTNQADVPVFLSTASGSGSDTSTNHSAESTKTISFAASHKFPLHGGAQFSYGYSSFDGGTGTDQSSGSNTVFNANISITPKPWFASSFETEYNSDLSGLVEQQLAATGNVGTQVNVGTGSHELSFTNFDNLSLWKGIGVGLSASRTYETALGETVTSDHFSAVVNYHFIKPLWGSVLIYGGIIDQSNETGHEGTGVTAGVNVSHWIHGFDLSGSLSYDQDVQTVMATEISSSYTFLANAKRRYGRNTRWDTSLSGYRSGLGQEPGSSSHSESYTSSLTYKRYAGSASYTTSVGTALFTPTGLVTVPVSLLPVLNNNQFIFENASGYSLSLTAGIFPRSTLNVSYGNSTTSTTAAGLLSSSSSSVLAVYTQYQLRAMTITAGYTHLMQGVSAANPTPTTFTTYNFGIQRWFKAF